MAQELLKINLLPESARKPAQLPMQQLHRTPLAAIALVVLVGLPLALWVPLQLNRVYLQQLTKKARLLEPKQAEVAKVQGLLARLRAQQAVFQELKGGKDTWAQRLNILSDLTPTSVWFTELSLDRSKGLVLQGMALASQGPEMVTVTRLVQELQSNATFASPFKQIQLESIKRVQQGEFDVVQFTITCTIVPVAAP
ncbi:MAG: PilN domain-containing protein [Candidatus Omnitrophica bacterium]|nr:PilN domain-containing protein [Candidatus Omnitrophota bacterium]